MYAFGDERNPLIQSVELVEKYTIDYIFKLLERSSKRASRRGNSNKVNELDVKYCLRNEPKAYHRLETLIKARAATKNDKKYLKKDIEEGMKKKRAKLAD